MNNLIQFCPYCNSKLNINNELNCCDYCGYSLEIDNNKILEKNELMDKNEKTVNIQNAQSTGWSIFGILIGFTLILIFIGLCI